MNIDFPSEYLTGISGTYGSAHSFNNTLTSLAFLTNKTQHGPFGTKSGTPFSVNANGGVVTGFHGRHGPYLEAIGLFIKPACVLSITNINKQPSKTKVPRSAAAVGGRDWDDGVFSAVQFSYLKNDGSDFLSPFHAQ